MDARSNAILSVGIDIGTTSTHLTLSRLRLGNASRANEPGRMVIEDRQIIYQSPVYFTPLKNDSSVDAESVLQIVFKEYACAKVIPENIDTGAVIVTGETAAKRNAPEIVKSLSGLAGKFVVASAGPNLEAILAARGSGAAVASLERNVTICNIDIGGGTANLAIFRKGEPEGTACLAVGGRCIMLDDDFRVVEISESGRLIAREVLNRDLSKGQVIDLEDANRLARFCAECIIDVMTGGVLSKTGRALLITPPLAFEGSIDEYWFSGGVAELMRSSCDGAGSPAVENLSPTLYGDLGVLLGTALSRLLAERNVPYFVPEHPIRATVIGAGMYSLQLSGSTVSVAPQILPISNLPVIRPFGNASTVVQPESLSQRLGELLVQYDLDWSEQAIALFLPGLQRMGYGDLRKWAHALKEVADRFKAAEPLVVVCTHDIAAALGQLLRAELPGRQVVVLDGIAGISGDFIDIGEPLANNLSTPVVLKDLVFGSQERLSGLQPVRSGGSTDNG
jgi:ethanolamine utilization protein EutA